MPLVLTALCLAVGSPYTQAAQQLEILHSEPAMHRAVLATEVASLDTGEVIYRRNHNKLLVPASTLKLLTTIAALEKLGDETRFVTDLGSSGGVRDGTLEGNLVIRGGGDPTLGAEDLWPLLAGWADALRAQGIRRVRGDIVGDESLFGATKYGPGWMWDDMAWDFSAPINALAIQENVVTVTLAPAPVVGDRVSAFTALPECLTYINDVLTVPSGKGSDVQAARQADGTTVLTGFVAADVQAKSIDLAMQDPALCTARLTRAALASRGILVTGTARMATAEESIADFQVLATHSSEPLGQVATELLKRSQNLYAEMLLRHFAVESRGKTGEAGLGVVEDVLRTAGVPDDAYRLYDGSGLSRYDML
ncbi:MAG: D-alanyl-D-alanine carboxypeptidase/D-alanyl-D-alanine-endopeptidase, partial [Myxococcota bacterium]